jgi:hypothetical protein
VKVKNCAHQLERPNAISQPRRRRGCATKRPMLRIGLGMAAPGRAAAIAGLSERRIVQKAASSSSAAAALRPSAAIAPKCP